MKSAHGFPLLLLALATTGCNSTQNTVGDGAFQKRRLRTGWHVDLGLRPDEAGISHAEIPARLKALRTHSSPLQREPLAALNHEAVASVEHSQLVHQREPRIELATAPEQALRPAVPEPSEPINDEPKARWNPWAVPAFALALGTVAYAILGTSNVVAVLAVLATLVLASIAVRKGRTNEWRGKGFAIAALMIGTLSALITLIAVLAG